MIHILVANFVGTEAQTQRKELSFFFKTLDEAKKFALKRNILFEIIVPTKRKILKKSYSQNFMKKKMSDPNKFCPLWLYKIIISVTVYDYIVRDIAIFVSTKKFESFFSKHYKDLTVEEIENGATAIIQFLGEVKTKDPFLLLNHFTYSIVQDMKKKMDSFFKKNPYDGDSEKSYNCELALKDFKVFSFSCRSGLTKTAPAGWDIYNETELGLLNKAIGKEFSIDDMIDSVM